MGVLRTPRDDDTPSRAAARPANGANASQRRTFSRVLHSRHRLDTAAVYGARMSHNLTLHCGCIVYVACHPSTGIAHTRLIERRAAACRVQRHDVGRKLFLWELLPTADARGATSVVLQPNDCTEPLT